MKKTILVTSHNRPIQDATIQSMNTCISAGALVVTQSGVTDVTLARNLAISGALRLLERAKQSGKDSGTDVVLMVDDDMVFSQADAEALVTHARETGWAASAMYGTTLGTLAATRLKTRTGELRWATGLGLLAIPLHRLLGLQFVSEPFGFLGETNWGFTWSMAAGGNFWSEDYTLCRRLGGVDLLPIAVGHLKTVPIYPDEETVDCIRTGRRLVGDLDDKVLAHIEDWQMKAAFTAAEPDAEGRHGDARI